MPDTNSPADGKFAVLIKKCLLNVGINFTDDDAQMANMRAYKISTLLEKLSQSDGADWNTGLNSFVLIIINSLYAIHLQIDPDSEDFSSAWFNNNKNGTIQDLITVLYQYAANF
jgi:hypothetical protein